jgi:hypothetical protein
MRGLQVTEFTALDAVVDLIRDMPIGEPQAQAIVDALSRRLDDAVGQRFAAVVEMLGDVHEALETLAAAEHAAASECSGCAGTGGERAPCRPCGGRGVVSIFSDEGLV